LGQDKKITERNNISVIPGQVLTITVGVGGQGGAGSGPSQNGGCGWADAGKHDGHGFFCAGNGEAGGTGGKGSPGYLKINWEQ
jgi:hypothetical protein